MNAQLSKLLEKKKAAGILNGQDALAFLRHVRAVGDASGKWTSRDFDELTPWQFGLPTRTQFQIVAGPVGAHAPKRVDVSPERNGKRRERQKKPRGKQVLDSKKWPNRYQCFQPDRVRIFGLLG